MSRNSYQNSNRQSSVKVERNANALHILGYTRRTARRLAQRIVEGVKTDRAGLLSDLSRAARHIHVRIVGQDLTMFGPLGYAVVDFHFGVVDFVTLYSKGENFDSATGLYRSMNRAEFFEAIGEMELLLNVA